MKYSKNPPFKQNAVAIGFTLGVHLIAVVGFLYLGMSKPPVPPKQIKTVLVKPEDLPPPEPKVLEQTDSAETTHTNTAPEITQTAEPVETPAPQIPVTTPAVTAAALNAQKAAQAAKAAAEAQEKAEKLAAEQAKQRAQANAAEKAKADAKAKAAAEEEARASSAKKAAEEAANKKAEAKKIASSAKRDFQKRIYSVWEVPPASRGQQATVRVTLSDSGAVLSVVATSNDPDLKASIEAAVRAAAPYPMPSDPDARREARSYTSVMNAAK